MVAGLGIAGQTVSASQEDDSGGKCSCPEDLALLAKYEYDEETGDLEFEEGYEPLNIDGSEITFSDIVTKEGSDEIIAFSWDSDPYYVTSMTVKAGTQCLTLEQSGTSGTVDLREELDEDPVPALSNVSFCKILYYQVDFVEEDLPIEPPRYGGEGLISAMVGNSEDGKVDERKFSKADLLADGDWRISVSSDGTTASVDFEVVEQPDEPLLLASYEMPGPTALSGSRPEIDLQQLVDYEVDSFDEGDTGSLTVDLPQIE
jgi:hypothetical protein